jgi:hypothetical protein
MGLQFQCPESDRITGQRPKQPHCPVKGVEPTGRSARLRWPAAAQTALPAAAGACDMTMLLGRAGPRPAITQTPASPHHRRATVPRGASLDITSRPRSCRGQDAHRPHRRQLAAAFHSPGARTRGAPAACNHSARATCIQTFAFAAAGSAACVRAVCGGWPT